MADFPNLAKCPKFIKKWLEPVLLYAKSRTPLSGPGIAFSDAPSDAGRSGTVTVQVGASPASGTAALLPLQPFNASDDMTQQIGVTFGTYQNANGGDSYTPTLDGGDPLDAVPPPRMVITGTTIIYAKVSRAAGADPVTITAVDIQQGASQPSADASYWYQTLASVTWDSGGSIIIDVLPNVSGSQMYQRCGTADLSGVV